MKEFDLYAIAELIGGELHGDPALKIKNITALEEATEGDITLLRSEKHLSLIPASKASAFIIPHTFPDMSCAYIKVKDISFALAILIPVFYPESRMEAFISKHAFVSPSARLNDTIVVLPYVYIGNNATIGRGTIVHPFTHVGNEVSIGEYCLIHPSVVICDKVKIGNRVIVQAGAVIGSDGFGYARENNKFLKIPHKGEVIIEDEVEIGANACIDRATLGKTIIKKGTKIDNLVQIAHNCQIGENCALAALVGLSGSTSIGDRVMMGGQSATAGHLQIGNDSLIGGQAGVTRNLNAGSNVMGTPAIDLNTWKRIQVLLGQIPELFDKIKKLEEKISLLHKKE
ncbi:MAG: UDP-3-O-(3-hydroxymyristoyl)glucosamine N-acyltransferase [Candidatus Fischerbacteria bacterium RBG_13_37_8]|uniref:UDP-3-O-acylglucosamine N-acyltransferase n=1 Tax=Candidatus Fischerbacteria bacterium RBG_13_37_8 TaxID=1817863 RepID=A0A1F5VFQ7_9BACT|nr:MAG: UDP-3-O-(3-hydroxymyristoyl)glucosamine N-acyltransferase [Candidatus Fischerbacteria bacterium RBG_13_37_8]